MCRVAETLESERGATAQKVEAAEPRACAAAAASETPRAIDPDWVAAASERLVVVRPAALLAAADGGLSHRGTRIDPEFKANRTALKRHPKANYFGGPEEKINVIAGRCQACHGRCGPNGGH